jgi:hypothetical protein
MTKQVNNLENEKLTKQIEQLVTYYKLFIYASFLPNILILWKRLSEIIAIPYSEYVFMGAISGSCVFCLSIVSEIVQMPQAAKDRLTGKYTESRAWKYVGFQAVVMLILLNS